MASISESHPLDSGAAFPTLSLDTAKGTSLSIPAEGDAYTVLLVYRGEW